MKIYFVNEAKDFQDAESARSGHSHVTSRPVSFQLHGILEGMLRFFWSAEPQRRAAKHLGHTWYIGKRFQKKSKASSCVFYSTFYAGIESMEFVN